MSELERWETRFSAPGYLFGDAPNEFLTRQAHRLKPGQTALSIADGEGRNGVWLAQQGLDVLAVDFSPTALAKAQALAAQRGVMLRTEQADILDWTWPDAAFDVVVAIFIQFPGGLLLMQGYRPEQLGYRTGGPDKVEHLYTRALLTESFGDFASVQINEHDSVIREGSGHNGMSALIDLVAVK
jgi:hypothetical protein